MRFAVDGLNSIERDLNELRLEAIKGGITLPQWLEKDGSPLEPWIELVKASIIRFESKIPKEPKTVKDKFRFAWKGSEKEFEKTRNDLRENLDCLVVVQLTAIASVPILRKEVKKRRKSEPQIPSGVNDGAGKDNDHL